MQHPQIPVPLSVDVSLERAKARAEADGCDLSVGAHRVAQDAVAKLKLDSQPPKPKAAKSGAKKK